MVALRSSLLKGLAMSHIVTINTEIRCAESIKAACSRLSLSAPVFGRHQLFTSHETGWGVRLQDWKYPVVCNVNTGKVAFDNFRGRWGAQSRLDSFLQAYAVEKAKLEAQRNGHTCTEQTQADGSIKLTVNV